MAVLQVDLPLSLELQRRSIPQPAVRPPLSVLSTPAGNANLRVQEREEHLLVEKLVSEPTIETLDIPVLPWSAFLEGSRVRALLLELASQCRLHELRPVVTAEILGCAVFPKQTLQHGFDFAGRQSAFHLKRQTLARERVHPIEDLEFSPIQATVADEVLGPDVAWMRGAQRRFLLRQQALLAAFVPFSLRQTFLFPQPVDAFVIERVSLTPQPLPGASLARAHFPMSQFSQALHKLRVLRTLQRTCPPLRQLPLPQKLYPFPPLGSAYQFLASNSLQASISKSRAASNFLSRAFSFSNSGNLWTSFTPTLPNLLRQREKVFSVIPCSRQISTMGFSPFSACERIATICSSLNCFCFILLVSLSMLFDEKTHSSSATQKRAHVSSVLFAGHYCRAQDS